MPDFVLEIGTEEVPASAVVPALVQMDLLIRELLSRERLAVGAVRTYGTPRRLVIYAAGVAARQEDAIVQHRGPAKAAAFDASGEPTRAAEGFARKYGLQAADLAVRITETGEYVFAEQKVEGRPAHEVLGAALPGLVSGLSFPKFMRWGEGGYRFSRPIRWIVALVGDDVASFEIEGVHSGRESSGHRFLPIEGTEDQHRFTIDRADYYFERVAAARVIIDPLERCRAIETRGNELADAAGLRIVWDAELLHEVTYVVEYPTAFMGSFDPQYLDLPRPVLVSAMRKHQRYFTVENPDGRLAPRFLAVRNGGDHGLDVVREGNERVLAFRFNDAAHHDAEDRKTTLTEKRECLRRVVFLQKLGTMWDKTARLEKMVVELCVQLGQNDLQRAASLAAQLSKADLTSSMVQELPDLQGQIGCEYALREGIDPGVARAIAEHYQPKGAGDPLPESLLGKLLALADRLDLMVAAFSLGHVPTGSSDPFGLRRAAAGIVALLVDLPESLRLPRLIDGALAALSSESYYQLAGPLPEDRVRAEVRQFFRPRVEAILDEMDLRSDLAEAVLGCGYDSLPGTLARARFLHSKLEDPSWVPMVQAATRIRNILRPTDGQRLAADFGRLEHPTEQRLLAALDSRPAFAEPAPTADWEAAWADWAAVVPDVEQFFLDVLVNAEEPALRAARLALLETLDRSFTRLCDFSKIADL